MSATTTPPAPVVIAAVDTQTTGNNSLWTPQMIMGMYGMTIVAGAVAAAIFLGAPETRGQAIGAAITFGGLILGFYFGSSKGSQDKDTANVKLQERSVVPAPTPVAPIPPTPKPLDPVAAPVAVAA